MARPLSLKREALLAAVSTLIAIISAVEMVGKPARWVLIVGLVAGTLGTGIAIGKAMERRRYERKAGGSLSSSP